MTISPLPTAPAVPVPTPDSGAGHAATGAGDTFAALVAGLLAPAAGSTVAGPGEEPGAPAGPAEPVADEPTAESGPTPAPLPVWPVLVDHLVPVPPVGGPVPEVSAGPTASSRAAATPAAPGSAGAPATPATSETPVAPVTPVALAAPVAPVAPAAPVVPASQVTLSAAPTPAGPPAQAARTASAVPVAAQAAVDSASPAAPEPTADPTHPAAEPPDTAASGPATGTAATSPAPGAAPGAGPEAASASAPLPAPASVSTNGATTGPMAGPVTAPAPTAAVTPTSPEGARPGPVVAQVVPEVTRMVSRGDGVHRLTMRLQPEALGAVRVTLTVRDGEVHVQLAAGEDARRALAEGAPELRRVLELAGASDARVVVRDLTGTAVGPLAPSTPGGSAGPLDQSPGPHAGTGGDASQPGTGRGDQDQRARTRGGAPAMDGLIDGANPLRPDPVGGAPRGIDLTM